MDGIGEYSHGLAGLRMDATMRNPITVVRHFIQTLQIGDNMIYDNIITGEMNCILPNPLNATFNPTMEQYNAAGYREQVSIDNPIEGFRVVKYAVQEIDSTTCKLIVAEQVNIAEEQAAQEAARIAAEQARQDAKSLTLKTVENTFLLMCDQLTGVTTHTKLGFDQINAVISGLTDQNQAVMLSLKLLEIDAEAKREGGLLWWDTCTWHSDI